MTELTRRGMLSAAGAATLAAWLPKDAMAAAPAAGKQAPGFYRYKVGDIEVTVITDGANRLPVTDAFVVNVKKEEVNAALVAAHMQPGVFIGPYNPIVLNIGGKLTLVDTGTSERAYIASKGATGQLLTNMAAAGIDPKSIDTVLISHFHGDHINGLLRADNSLAFPNAEIAVPANEHQYFMDEGNKSRAPQGRMTEVFANAHRVMKNAEVMKRLRTYAWDKDVLPGVHAVGTPGHTPGHTSHVVTSGNSKVYVQADVTHAPFLFARHPGWHAFYDQDPVLAEATRRKVYDMLSAERMMVQGFHYPFPSVAHVEKAGDGYREIPMPWNPVI